MIGNPALASVASFSFESIDEVDDVVEPASGARPDAASGDGDGQMRLASSGSPDQHDIALLGDEAAAGEFVDEGLVDRRFLMVALAASELGGVAETTRARVV